jgi:hypothetical protein
MQHIQYKSIINPRNTKFQMTRLASLFRHRGPIMMAIWVLPSLTQEIPRPEAVWSSVFAQSVDRFDQISRIWSKPNIFSQYQIGPFAARLLFYRAHYLFRLNQFILSCVPILPSDSSSLRQSSVRLHSDVLLVRTYKGLVGEFV